MPPVELASLARLFSFALGADVPILGVPGKDGVVRTYTYSELERATNLLAYHLASVVPPRAKGDVFAPWAPRG